MRVGQKSAEAVVVKKPHESEEERRAEGRCAKLSPSFDGVDQWSETAGRNPYGGYPGLAKGAGGKGETLEHPPSGLRAKPSA